MQHRDAHPHTSDFGFVDLFELPGVMRNVGRGPTHVKPDDLVKAGQSRSFGASHDAAGRPGEYCIAPTELRSIGEAT